MNDRVRVEITDGVADVRLIRTDKMNALDDAMFMALVETGEALKADKSVRCVVLSGEGRAFCAGLDAGNFGKMAEGGDRYAPRKERPAEIAGQREYGVANRAQYAVWVWREIPVPVIAAIHGVAFGGGCQLALGCDLRFIAPDARMSVMEIKWGLVPDMAGMVLMRELARTDVVRELTFTGRIFSGEEALKIGFATRLSAEPLADALQMAHDIAAKSPHAIRAGKRLLNASLSHSAAEMLLAESVEQKALIGSANQSEAVRANIERRAPTFIRI